MSEQTCERMEIKYSETKKVFLIPECVYVCKPARECVRASEFMPVYAHASVRA